MDDLVSDLVRKITNLEFQLASALQRIEQLESQSNKTKLPFLERFPNPATIVRMKAQVWQNEPKQAVPKYRVKVAVWDRPEAREKHEQEKWPNGYYNNWCFNLQPRDLYVQRTNSFEEIASHCWMGPLTIKQKKGTRQHRDHIAAFNPEDTRLALNILGEWFPFGVGIPLNPTKSTAPTHLWYLDL